MPCTVLVNGKACGAPGNSRSHCARCHVHHRGQPCPADADAAAAPRTKTCARCHTAKPLAQFSAQTQAKGGRQAYCKPCAKVYRHEREYKEPFDMKRQRLEQQGQRCAICARGVQLDPAAERDAACTDHCHQCPLPAGIRGELCKTCNAAIGLLKDNPDWLEKAMQYLHTHVH
jgi:hypothetical protein